MRTTIALAVAALATIALATTSAAAAPGPAESPQVEAWYTPLDPTMRPIGPRRPATPLGATAAERLDGPGRTTQGGRRLQSASGCAAVDVSRIGRSSIVRSVVYKWHQVKGWCWSAGKVTRVDISTYPSDVDPNWRYRGQLPGSGGYYAWNGAGSGHWSLRQGSFENCILKYGCIGSEYPWVKVWVHGDGTYAYETGT
ncbi:MAG: hypothetical protein R3C15_03830 [Thermoleophilia bacterium]